MGHFGSSNCWAVPDIQGPAGSCCTLALLLLAALALQHGRQVQCYKISTRPRSSASGDDQQQQLHFADPQQTAPRQHKRHNRKRTLRLSQQARQQQDEQGLGFVPASDAAHAAGTSRSKRKKSGSASEDLRAAIFGNAGEGGSGQGRPLTKLLSDSAPEQQEEAAPARRRAAKPKQATAVAAEDLAADPIDDDGFLQRMARLKGALKEAAANGEEPISNSQLQSGAAAQKDVAAGARERNPDASDQAQQEDEGDFFEEPEVRSALDERLHRSLEEILARHQVEDAPALVEEAAAAASAEPAPEAAGEGGPEQPPPEAAGEGSSGGAEGEGAKSGGADEVAPEAQDTMMAEIDKVLEELSRGDAKEEASEGKDAAPLASKEVRMHASPMHLWVTSSEMPACKHALLHAFRWLSASL